jgi:hypothetical protein
MTDGLKRIEKEFEAFRSEVAECRDDAWDMADIREAYDRFSRLRNRYDHEMRTAHSLSPTEAKALSKVFDKDVFIESVGRIRGISEHVETGEVVLHHINGSPFRVRAESSAAAVFASDSIDLIDTNGTSQHIGHPQWLNEMERLISHAFAKINRQVR